MSVGNQVAPLVGVALGATLSWGTAALTDRARFRRDQASHWRERRLTAYSEFAVATKQTMSVLFRVGASLNVDEQTEPLTLDEAKPLLSAAFHERESAYERMRLVGSDASAEGSPYLGKNCLRHQKVRRVR